jgi:hypothetical protein
MNKNQSQLIRKQPNSIALEFPETFKLVQFGRHRGWDVAVLGQAPMLAEPLRLKDWLLVPAQEDTSQIPSRAYQRIQTLFLEGIRPNGFVVVHEAPRQLPSGVVVQQPPFYMPMQSDLLPALSAFGKVAATVLTATAAVAGMALVASMFVGVALLDPILIAVTPDDYWVEIDRWLA